MIRRGLVVCAALAVAGCGAIKNPSCEMGEPLALVAEARKQLDSVNLEAAWGASVTLADHCILVAASDLAKSRDSAADVAQAVTSRCEQAIAMQAAAYKDYAAAGRATPATFYEITTGRTVTAEERTFARAKRRALAAVVEARARNC